MTRFISALLLVLVALAGSVQAGTLTFTTYYHNDHLGSPVAATDERNELLWRAHFRPYGERQENPAKGAFGTPGYTGHVQDKDSGLVYAGARYYDPLIGRFMAVDPVGVNPESPASFNRYAYANNNPMRFFDPDGRMSDDAILHGGWVPGFEGNLYNASANWGPISGTKRGLTPQGELVSGGSVKGASVAKGDVQANKAAGDAFEAQIKSQLQRTDTDVVQQVTIKTQSGVRTRVDLLSRDSAGAIRCTECKASATAPLTKNQRLAFPEIQQSGGVVVGKGKPGYPGGTQIPSTKVDIVRPKSE